MYLCIFTFFVVLFVPDCASVPFLFVFRLTLDQFEADVSLLETHLNKVHTPGFHLVSL